MDDALTFKKLLQVVLSLPVEGAVPLEAEQPQTRRRRRRKKRRRRSRRSLMTTWALVSLTRRQTKKSCIHGLWQNDKMFDIIIFSTSLHAELVASR